MSESLPEFLENALQTSLQTAEELFLKQSPPEKPFDNKYLSRDILLNLLKNPSFSEIPLPDELLAVSAYIHYLLGVNCIETEETSLGEDYIKKALSQFSLLPELRMRSFLNILQDIYNNLGYLFLNRDEMEKGMGCLGKADDLYLSIKDSDDVFCQNLRNLLQTQQRYPQAKFSFYYQMGLNKAKSEAFYTLTLFYLAQAYTKVGQKEKAAYYCGNTMRRQYENKEFQVKEWCVNAISLAEFYQNNNNFAQGYYLLQAGESLIPAGKRKKLKATFNMCFARLFGDFLKYMVKILSAENPNIDTVRNTVNRKQLIFETFPIKFIELEIPKDYEGVAKIFRFSNTQYKKAFGFFLLDGYVTEHIEMSFELSDLLKTLSLLETDPNRRLALLEKRRDIVEPIQSQLNPKAYPAFSQRLLVESAEIFNEMFENRFQEIFSRNEIKSKKNKVENMNQYGFSAIRAYEKIENLLMEQQKEQKDPPKEHYRSVINTKFNLAKAYNKICASSKQERVDLMRKSLDNYKFIVNFLKELYKTKGNLEWDFSEQLKICTEMVELLPAKIDKINSE